MFFPRDFFATSPADAQIHTEHHDLQVSIVLIYLLYLTEDLAKKQDDHGEAVRRIPWHGYVIFSRLLAATSSRWTGRARCRRILLNYLNQLRKKLISTLICFISFFNLLPT